MRIALVVLFLLCRVSVFAESHPPASSRAQKTEKSKKQEYTDLLKICTDSLVSINKLLNAQRQEQTVGGRSTNIKNEEHAKEWWKAPDIWVAAFTGILAFITGVLAFYTYKLWSATKTMVDEASLTSIRQAAETKDALDISRNAANAAEKTAQAMYLGERAYIFISVSFKDGNIYTAGNDQSQYGTLTVDIVNHGKTPAILKRIYARDVVCEYFPKDLIETNDSVMPPGIAVGSGKCSPCDLKFKISEETFINIKNNRTKWFCHGCVEYVDIFRNEHKTGFCWEFIQEKGQTGFMASNNEYLNYHT